MTKRKLILLCCYLLLWGATKVNAQSGTVASGQYAVGVNGNVSYSIGQIDYKTDSSGGYSMSQGLQQPYEITVVSGINETAIELSASVYPNPTADFVTLSFIGSDAQSMSYILFDMQGKLIEQMKINKKQTRIKMSELANGTYFIKVLNNQAEVKVFKIIKNS